MKRKIVDIAANFFSKVDKGDGSGCWLWTASLQTGGYGNFIVHKHSIRAHKWSYEYYKGPVPKGLQIDHLCRVRHCVNPDHLEAVPARTNVLRSNSPAARNAQKTHCPKGHPYEGENLIIAKRKDGRLKRICHECRKAWCTKWYHGNRKQAMGL